MLTVAAGHPIAAGLPKQWTLPATEMYAEPFHVPEPDRVIFKETFSEEEWFRSGCLWHLEKERFFYFRPGHETHPHLHSGASSQSLGKHRSLDEQLKISQLTASLGSL